MVVDVIPNVLYIDQNKVHINVFNLFNFKKTLDILQTNQMSQMSQTNKSTFDISWDNVLDEKCVLDKSFVEKLINSKKIYKHFMLKKFLELMHFVQDRKYEFHVNIQRITVATIEQNLKFIKLIVDIFYKLNYTEPEIVFIHNAPYCFQSLWSLLKSFIDKETQKKIKILENNKIHETIKL